MKPPQEVRVKVTADTSEVRAAFAELRRSFTLRRFRYFATGAAVGFGLGCLVEVLA